MLLSNNIYLQRVSWKRIASTVSGTTVYQSLPDSRTCIVLRGRHTNGSLSYIGRYVVLCRTFIPYHCCVSENSCVVRMWRERFTYIRKIFSVYLIINGHFFEFCNNFNCKVPTLNIFWRLYWHAKCTTKIFVLGSTLLPSRCCLQWPFTALPQTKLAPPLLGTSPVRLGTFSISFPKVQTVVSCQAWQWMCA